MMLPQISNNVGKSKSEIVSMRGINWSDQLQDGDMRDSLNLSARRYPSRLAEPGRSRKKLRMPTIPAEPL